MTFHLHPPAHPRYVVSLEPGLQDALLTPDRAAADLLRLLDDSRAFAAVHLPASDVAREPLLRASALTARLPRTGLIAEVDIARKHPVNVARALVSLSHLSGHRAGWGLRPADEAALRAHNPWLADTPANAGAGSIRREFAALVTALSRSWPYESLIGDRARGWFHVEGAIGTIRHRGNFAVEGVLNIPSAPHGAIPFLTFDTDTELRGHLRVGREPVRSPAADAADVALFPIEAPSNAVIGPLVDQPVLYFVTGIRHAEQVRALKRDAELARPDDEPAEADASIWDLLGVRPSVAALDPV
ncbi:hypothetical protein V5F53_08575 [Xanthobacter sp. V4C-4]|uniref:hypothetical protein n=1 Tax=Xanthobacter cornucopiae TaxID=3119924 RepID=UPI00372A2416